MDGWIKLHRKILEWGWYADPCTKVVFLHLLLTANFKDTVYMGKTIHAGQTVTGRKALAESLGISEQNVRTALKRLKSTNEITIEVTNKFSIITIVNWEFYQGDDEEVTNKTTNELTINQPATNQQLTSNQPHRKNDKKEKNDKKYIYSDVPEELKAAFMAWAAMRAKIKKPITSKDTVKRALKRLDSLADTTEKKIELIELATDRCWQSFYLPKKDEQKAEPTPRRYKEFEKEDYERDDFKAEAMPDEIRDKLSGMFGGPQ